MAQAFQLRSGDSAPIQQSPFTCGSASLTVARMLVDVPFARWMVSGESVPSDVGSAAPGATEGERFAAYERLVHGRTNRLSAARGRINLPWPRTLGTPPWGARSEVEATGSRPGTAYDIDVIRHATRRQLGEYFDDLVDVVTEGEPGLLYVGNAFLPRHVTLVLPESGDRKLDVYDPASGKVSSFTREAFQKRRLGLSGWNTPWIVVRPTGMRTVRAFGFATSSATSRVPGVTSGLVSREATPPKAATDPR